VLRLRNQRTLWPYIRQDRLSCLNVLAPVEHVDFPGFPVITLLAETEHNKNINYSALGMAYAGRHPLLPNSADYCAG
jgi:hypothetical protein